MEIMMQSLKPYFSAALFSVLFLIGCSGGDDDADRVPVFKVSGKITMNGSPVANAIVTFSPLKEQPVAYGRTSGNGQYTLTTYEAGDGAASGDYIVLVSKSTGGGEEVSEEAMHKAIGAGKDPSSMMHSASKKKDATSLLPEKYASSNDSDLTATVTESGQNEFSFDLKL